MFSITASFWCFLANFTPHKSQYKPSGGSANFAAAERGLSAEALGWVVVAMCASRAVAEEGGVYPAKYPILSTELIGSLESSMNLSVLLFAYAAFSFSLNCT